MRRSFFRRAVLALTLGVMVGAVVTPTMPAEAQIARPRIINGNTATIAEFPSFAGVFRNGIFSCGGTVIADHYVLTAAHCVRNATADGSLTVMVGTDNFQARPTPKIPVAEIYVHSRHALTFSRNDVALLRTDRVLNAPAQSLAANGSNVTAGQTLTVIGWGASAPSGDPATVSPQLLKTSVPVQPDDLCQRRYRYPIIDARAICAGSETANAVPNNDSCTGDSGGPLYNGAGVQVGIVSYGGDYCGDGTPAVYVEVDAYIPWIRAVMQSGSDDHGLTAVERSASPAQIGEAVSEDVFGSNVPMIAVLAQGGRFPDALAGSSLHAGRAPMFFTEPDGTVTNETHERILDSVTNASQKGTLYVLGGPNAIPDVVVQDYALQGIDVRRIAGATRTETAIQIARETMSEVTGGELGLGTVLIAKAWDWPDAVTASSISAYFGTPVLLTDSDRLHPETAAFLRELQDAGKLANPPVILGGTSAISANVEQEVQAIVGKTPVRLSGPTRIETAARILQFTRYLLGLNSETHLEEVVVVNLRRDDAWSHVLAGSVMTGAHGGVFAPVEGHSGEQTSSMVLNALCGLSDSKVYGAGDDTTITLDSMIQTIEATERPCTNGRSLTGTPWEIDTPWVMVHRPQ